MSQVDVPRIQRSKPWLSAGDVVLGEMLNVLVAAKPPPGTTAPKPGCGCEEDEGEGGSVGEGASGARVVGKWIDHQVWPWLALAVIGTAILVLFDHWFPATVNKYSV